MALLTKAVPSRPQHLRAGLQSLWSAGAVALCGLLWLGLVSSVQAANIYKYLDERGRTVFNSTIPPEVVKNGYTIMNERGQVIEVVPRAPTAAEIAAREAMEQARLQQEDAARRQQESDGMLLRTYRSVDEIMAQREARVMRLDSRLIELTGNLGKVDAEVTRLTQLVDAASAEGRQREASMMATLEEQSAQRLSLQNEITVVEAEKQEEIAQAERNAQRLQQLTQDLQGTAVQTTAQ
jgi:hypothetical protein